MPRDPALRLDLRDDEYELSGPREGADRRILAVEDSASARRLFQAILLKLGTPLPNIRLASTALEAMQVYTQWRPDIVFLDVELHRAPDGPTPTAAASAENGGGAASMDGPELAAHLLTRDPHLKLVVCTASNPTDPRVQEIVKRGAKGVITKPVLADKVEQILRALSTETVSRPRRPTR